MIYSIFFLGPLRPTVSQFPSSSSSSAASDSAFASSDPSSANETSPGLGCSAYTPPYDDVLPDRHLCAYARRPLTSTTVACATVQPGCDPSPTQSQPTSRTSSKSSLASRASSLNSLSVIDESTPTPSQLASARLSSERTASPISNGFINRHSPALVRRGSSDRGPVSPMRAKLPNYDDLIQERVQLHGMGRDSSTDLALNMARHHPRHKMFEKKVSEVIMM